MFWFCLFASKWQFRRFKWNGRQLQSIEEDGTPKISYKYNADGQRISKTLAFSEDQPVTIEYFYNGEILAGQKTGNDVLVFMYDNNGDIFGFTYNSEPYYYVKNAQNDVYLIVNSDCQSVVLYQYDAWGNITACYDASDNNLSSVNPITYRSYYSDLELGMYYLNSRYYMPALHRFLNADGQIDSQAGFIGYNLFAYGANTPVNNIDTTGQGILKNALACLKKSFNTAKTVISTQVSNIKSGAKSAAKAVAVKAIKQVRNIRSKLAKSNMRTYTVGGNGAGAFIIGGMASGGIAVDKHGNVGTIVTAGMGGGTPSLSSTAYVGRYNTPSIQELEGLSVQVGGSVDVGFSIGAEHQLLISTDGATYSGGCVMAGAGFAVLGTPIPVEMHGEVGYTYITHSVNVFDKA